MDGSIIVGGAKSAMAKDNSVWYDNSDDSALIEPAKEYFDEYMQRRFVGWEDSGAYVDQVWTGSKSNLECPLWVMIVVGELPPPLD